MWRIILMSTCIILGAATANAEPFFSNLRKREAGAYSGSYAGSHGGGNGAGYNYNDYEDYGFGAFNPYTFHQNILAQVMAQNIATQNAIASTIAMGDATVMASASNLPNDIQDYNDYLLRQQADLFDNIRRQTQYNYNSKHKGNGNDNDNDSNSHKDKNKDSRYAPNYSAASASIGPRGGFQSAAINPENPDTPNFSNRFASTSPDGYKGVSVSTFSSSSDVNGKKTNYRVAQTTINDNGRITTHKVES